LRPSRYVQQTRARGILVALAEAASVAVEDVEQPEAARLELAPLPVPIDVIMQQRVIVPNVVEQSVLRLVAVQTANAQVVPPALEVLEHISSLGDGVARIREARRLARRARAAVVR